MFYAISYKSYNWKSVLSH